VQQKLKKFRLFNKFVIVNPFIEQASPK